MKTAHLQPERLWYYFEKISAIPRESGNEQAVSDYIVSVAQSLELDYRQDSVNNVIVYKNASADKNDARPVILQGHLDMVCVKDSNVAHDFTKDAIDLQIEGDDITAKGTSLGGDNGIAVAMMLAILEDNSLPHPALTCLFTVQEETTMKGAIEVDAKHLKGDYLINLDSEEEGVLLAANAGGEDVEITLPCKRIDNTLQYAYQISVKGLKGGHSGSEIHKGRANAIKLMARLLVELRKIDYQLFEVEGGEKMNAIAKQCSARLVCNLTPDQLIAQLTPIEEMFQNEYSSTDPGIMLSFEKCQPPHQVYDAKTSANLIDLLRLLPQGVQSMSADIDGLVESSTNLGVLKQSADGILVGNSLRSAVKSRQDEIATRMEIAAKRVSASARRHADYPAWPFKKQSELRDIAVEAYRELTGRQLKVAAIHAGLECGLFAQKMPDIDMISIGPNMEDVHTANERLSIRSTTNTYQFLLNILNRIN